MTKTKAFILATVWAFFFGCIVLAVVITKQKISRQKRIDESDRQTQIQLRQLDSSIQRLQKTMAYGDSVIQRTKKAIQGMDEVDRRAEELDREFNKVMRRANNNRPFPQQGAGQ